MALGFVYELEKDVVDGPSDKRPQIEEFAVNAMKGRLQEVTLPRVLRIKEFEEIQNERLIDVALGEVGIEIRAFDETEEKLVNDLEVGPCKLKDRFVFLRIESIACGIDGRGYRPE